MDIEWPDLRQDVLNALDVLAAEPPILDENGHDPRWPDLKNAVHWLVDDTFWDTATPRSRSVPSYGTSGRSSPSNAQSKRWSSFRNGRVQRLVRLHGSETTGGVRSSHWRGLLPRCCARPDSPSSHRHQREREAADEDVGTFARLDPSRCSEL